jgi:uncharacterized protein (DUF1684 family)
MSDLDEFRRAKDMWMSLDAQSPLTPEQRRRFGGLAYFDEAPGLVLQVPVERIERGGLIEMPTSSGEIALYEEWGRIEFAVEGQPATLTIYRHPDSDSLFLPFRDATSGHDTYGAGRYLEVHDLGDGRVHLDFNYAYNPYCAYNEGYSCPMPPPGNRLSVPIRAGERNFEGATAEHRHE